MFDLSSILSLLISSILFGSLNGLLAIGLALLWRLLGVINFAHGLMILLGGYISFFFIASGVNPVLAISAPIVILVVANASIQKFFVNRVASSLTDTIIATLGIAYIIEGLVLLIWGPSSYSISDALLGSFLPRISLAGIYISPIWLEIFIFGTAATALLHLFLKSTYTGRAIRAVAQDKKVASLIGINVTKTYVITAALIGLINAIIGFLYLRAYSVTVGTASQILTVAFALSILIGFSGNLWVMFIAGIAIKIVENTVTLFIPVGLKSLVSIILIVILIIRASRSNGRGQ